MQSGNRKPYDARFDSILAKKIKCPYCKARIQAFQVVCHQCGVSKEQIAGASNQKAKQMMRDGEHGKIVMISKRPSDVDSVGLGWRVALGLFGTHCFYVGRKIRGWIMLGCMLAFIISIFVFPLGKWNDNIVDANGEITEGFEGTHPWREAVEDAGYLFPTDFLGVIPFVMWAMDSFAIVLGRFKYPVRLGEKASNVK